MGLQFSASLAAVEAVQIHHLAPCHHKITNKHLGGVCGCIDLGQCAQLGVGAEDQIDTGAPPSKLAIFAAATCKNIRLL